MFEPITTIEFYGELEVRYRPISGVAYTVGESMRMLLSSHPELKDYFFQNPDYSLVLRSPVGEVLIPSLEFPIAGKTIAVVPAIAGSGTVGRLIGGLAMVGIGIWTGGTSLIVAGATMVAQSIFFGYGDAPKEEEQKRSEILGLGSLNTAEGNSIPVVYGHDVLVGGLQVLSFAIKSEYTSL
jgi:predicted phage tail protein